ncbi:MULTISPECIES: antitoxin [Lacticaseibacillus]|uniref:Antitoxin n=1 Tax=Lacticaseibacillus casei DSM 20011 = JCM 1134 = ATCC 393 TaxID=1423732 RepID=A0AAD1ARY7_LACCA|nr:antitoxin [Lacticaseibacillus casei]HAJ54172.1 antitoxin [Lactobacillus sp.]MBI6598154.1 antitoxin [Lacticaseibacillus casei]MBO1481837.1 antitoxin [Lacticaseibacillus casei]MBO2417117.1 antitoxin [Lacticaseibacillus casei]MCK2081505.1 antitoxin [Lacticaseibacillus casei]
MKKQTSVTVTFDAAIKARLDAYCELNDTDTQDVITTAVAKFLQSQAPDINQLISGYVVMGQINTEISHAFSACESEAYAHIR